MNKKTTLLPLFHRKSLSFYFYAFIACLSAQSFLINVQAKASLSDAQSVTGFFENKVFDDDPQELFAVNSFNRKTDDTKRLQKALNKASKEKNGGVVILRTSKKNTNNRYRLARINVPSNIRLEVEPEVVLEMNGILQKKKANPFLFVIGRSNNMKKLNPNRAKNVEITSTEDGKYFTIDSKTNMPKSYGAMQGGYGKASGNTYKTGVNIMRSIPVGIYYIENFSVSNISIIDNHTESVSIQMYPDTDYKDGAYAIRGKKREDDVFLDGKDGEPLKMNADGAFIDDKGKVISDMFAIKRNANWGRTPIKGSVKNIKTMNSHTGYGAVQVYGGDWIEIRNIEAFNGIGVRIESGNGTPKDNMNRAGPYYTSINNIEISDVKVTNGFTGVWLKSHSKIIKNISVHNITAIDSGTALIVAKGTLCRKCRDLTRGYIENAKITGDIILERTITETSVAEVGFGATFFLSEEERKALKDTDGNGKITAGDLPRNQSGKRWYLIQPIAPILAISQLSADEIGDPSQKEGYFTVDYSKANIKGINLSRKQNFMYRTDMVYPNGNSAKKITYK